MRLRGISSRLLFILFLSGCLASARAAEDFSTWAHSAKLHVNTAASGADIKKTLTDFPLLVRITDSRILSQSAGDGSDLRFASESGSPLDFQIERWAPSQGKAEVWVRMPQIDSSSDKQYVNVYWGKPASAWLSDGSKVFKRTAGFYAVYHLGEGGTQKRSNSAGNWNHATPKNYEGDERVEGVIGMADSLDGAAVGGDYLDLGGGFDSLQSFTFNLWAYESNGTAAEQFLDLGRPDYSGPAFPGTMVDEFQFGRPSQGDSLSGVFYQGNFFPASVGAAKATTAGKWAFFGIAVAGKTVNIFKDGAKIASGTLPQEMRIQSRPLNSIGQGLEGFGGALNGSFAGKIDEPQLCVINHSAEWMKLDFESQRPDAKMYSWEFPAETKLAIKTQPEGLTVAEGHAFTLSVVAEGSGAISYRWLKDGTRISGATLPDFQVGIADLSDAGLYTCRITDGKDTLLSRAAAVIVPEDLSSWAHSRKILVNAKAAVSLSADVANVPILVRLGSGEIDFSQTAPDGRDLRFAALDGSPLAFGIERWAPDTAEIWVRLPKVSAAGGDAFTMYWGKSTALAASSPASVFSINDNWRAYYAFSDSASGSGSMQAGDATLNGFNADGNGVGGVADGVIGRGFGFFAAGGSHLLAPAAAIGGFKAFTVLAWVRENSAKAAGSVPILDPHIFGTGFATTGQEQFGLASRNGTLEAWVAGSPNTTYLSQTGGARLDDGSWHLVAVSSAGTDFSVYADGNSEFDLAGPDLPLAVNGLGIGAVRASDASWSSVFTGDIDAVQILGEAKSADWIKLAYAGQRPGAALLAFQAAADQAPPAPVIDPPGGSFDAAVAVSLSCSADSVRLFYTLDGSDPDTTAHGSTHLYASAFQLASDAQVKARAYRKGLPGPIAQAAFRIFALTAAGDTLAPGDSRSLDGLRRVGYPFQDASAPVLLLPGAPWNPKPAGFDRVGPLFQVRPLDSTAAFPGLSVTGDSLDSLSLFRRDANGAVLWMPPKDGRLWIPGAGTYFWGRDTLAPRIRVTDARPRGNDSLSVRILVEDNVAAVQVKIRFGGGPLDSLGWWALPSGDTLSFAAPVPTDPALPMEVNFSATDQSRTRDLPAKGYLTLPRPLPSVTAPLALKAGLKWKMAGMPLAPGLSLNLKELAARSGTGPLYAAVWRGRVPPDSGYKVLSGDDTLPGGKGFWIASDGEAPSLNFPPARAVASDSDGLFPIRLDSGWNLVTCPSLRPLAWPVSIHDGDAYLRSRLKPLFAYDDTGYTRPDSLRPWQAYYVHFDKDTVVHVGALAPHAAARLSAQTAAGASLRLDLSAGDGVRLSLGASRWARDGLGVEDEGQPPGFAAKSAAWLSRDGRSLSVDYVAWDPDRAMRWTLALRSQPAGAALIVPAAAFPPGREAWAVSPSRRLKWPLAPGSNIPVTGDDTLLLFAGTPAALAEIPELQSGRLAAGAFAARLRSAAGGLELTLDLPTEALVSARILDARGALLGRLAARPFSPGRHALSWSALSRTSAPLPQGAYWLDLQAQGQGWTHHQAYPASVLR